MAVHIRAKKLVPILTDWSPGSADIHAVFQTMNQLPAKVRALADLLAQRLAPYRKAGRAPLGPW